MAAPQSCKHRSGKGLMWARGTTIEHVGGCKVRFTCPAGHKTTRDYSKGPIPSRMDEWSVKRLVRYWQDRFTYHCKKC